MSLKDTNAFKITSLPSITSPVAPDLRQFLNRLRETIEDPNGLVTKAELVNTGAFQNNTIGNLEYIEPGEEQSYIAPPAPLNLAASGAMTSIMLTWDGVNYNSGYAYTEVWRASVDNLGVAVLIGTTTSGMYADAVGSDASHYYWVRFLNVINDIGPFNAIAGVLGETSPDVDYLLSQLTTSITNGQLAGTLAASINSTFHQNDAPTTKKDGTTLVAGDVWVDANGNDAVSIYNGSAWVSADVATQAYVGTEITQQVGYCERTVTASGAKNVATAYTTKTTCEAASVSGETFSWKDDTALAGEVKTVTTTADGNTATVQVNTGSINGINAKHTVKIDNAGHLSGYGLISTNNDATPTSEFGIRADNFWVAPPAVSASSAPTTNLYKGKVWVHSGTGAVQYYSGSSWGTTPTTLPFVVKTSATTSADGNTIPAGVYMEDAYIQNSSIVTAKIGDAAIDNAKIANAAITNAKINDLDASKITAGTINAARIAAGSITADKVTLNPQDVGAGAASGNDSMRISSTKIEIYSGGTLRVKLGNLA